ncbi:YHYH domain-containing protein [Candidatus Poribacteria bacterium]|nr:MAG: YHYH domain-containing protein [Candidatus Poribacteria bacterium]
MDRKVNFRILTAFFWVFSVLSYDFGDAHPGRTDANGGHYNRETGEYHKHVKEDSQSDEIDTDLVVSQNAIASDTKHSELRLAAWNIRIMSNESRTDAELKAIARTLADYNFIAIVELRDEVVLKRTQKILSQMGKTYQYQLSPAVGRGVKERYAFLYEPEFVSVVNRGELYPDAADGKDDFIRDPYWATFRAGEFDFSVIAVHVVWGDTVGPRKAEVRALADVYRYVQKANGAEDDVLLVGDFNRNPDDTESYSRIMAIPSMVRLFELPQKSHIRDSSLYDNIFFQEDHVKEYLDISGIDRFDETDFGNDDRAANLAVSDHRPVWAMFRTDLDDDGSDEVGSVSVKSANIHDVNGDGFINILDLVAVANGFGKTEPDINGDGTVNILDLVIIAGEFGR